VELSQREIQVLRAIAGRCKPNSKVKRRRWTHQIYGDDIQDIVGELGRRRLLAVMVNGGVNARVKPTAAGYALLSELPKSTRPRVIEIL
jgi:hypothetical protein